MRLWGRLSSVNVQKAVWALEELGLAYERVDAGGAFGIVDDPEYLRLNPNRLIPTLDDDGFVLWESNAIVRYLAAKHPEGGLWPQDLRRRADADRWMDWQISFTIAMRDAFWQLLRTPPEKQDPGAIERSLGASERFATILDDHLASRSYVAGEDFSMGDVAVGCAAHRWLNLPCGREERPHMRRWLERLYARSAAATVLVTPIG